MRGFDAPQWKKSKVLNAGGSESPNFLLPFAKPCNGSAMLQTIKKTLRIKRNKTPNICECSTCKFMHLRAIGCKVNEFLHPKSLLLNSHNFACR